MGALETSVSRIHRSRILSWSGGKNVFPEPGDNLKHCFLDLTKVEFWAFLKAENDF